MGREETSCATFYPAADCASGNGGGQEGDGEVQSVVTLNPPDCGYINFFTLCLSETDVLQPYRRWSLYENMDVKCHMQTWAMTALCCSWTWKIGASGKTKSSCHWGKQFREIFGFIHCQSQLTKCAGYICLELASNSVSFISPLPISHSGGGLSKMELSFHGSWRSLISLYRCSGKSSPQLRSSKDHLAYWALIRSGALIFIALQRANELLRNTCSKSQFYTAT